MALVLELFVFYTSLVFKALKYRQRLQAVICLFRQPF